MGEERGDVQSHPGGQLGRCDPTLRIQGRDPARYRNLLQQPRNLSIFRYHLEARHPSVRASRQREDRIYQSLVERVPQGATVCEVFHNALRKFISFIYGRAFFLCLSTRYQGPEYGVRSIFEKARKHAPCILVLEDLDSMVTDDVRSYFLNEMDGLVRHIPVLDSITICCGAPVLVKNPTGPERGDPDYSHQQSSRTNR